jgi:hypothetical protein
MSRTQIYKLFRGSLVVLAICGCALAQTYGGGGGGGMGGTYMPGSHSYGHGAAIGAALGGAAGATALYFGLRHHHRQVVGCVSPDGKNLTTDDGKHTYQLAGTEQVNAGEHVSVVGKKAKGDSGIDELEIQSVNKHMGQCEKQAALIEVVP